MEQGDGREKNGGARAGAGRKAKPVEDNLHDRLKKALKDGRKNKLDEIFTQLVKDATSTSFKVRHASRAMLLDRLFGKTTPPASDESDPLEGMKIIRVPIRLNVAQWQEQQVKPPE